MSADTLSRGGQSIEKLLSTLLIVHAVYYCKLFREDFNRTIPAESVFCEVLLFDVSARTSTVKSCFNVNDVEASGSLGADGNIANLKTESAVTDSVGNLRHDLPFL